MSFIHFFKLQGLSYAIRVTNGATLELTDNCFVGNDFVGPGAVLLASEEDLLGTSGNYGDDLDDGLVCPFIAIGSECHDFESEVCGANVPLLAREDSPPPTAAPASGAASITRGVSMAGLMTMLLCTATTAVLTLLF